MKYGPYLFLAIALPTFCLIYIIGLGYTPWVSAVLKLPAETEILLFTIQAGIGAAAIGHLLGYRRAEKAQKNKAGKLEHKEANLYIATREHKKQTKISLKFAVLVIGVLVIFIVPFAINPNAEFSGTDGQGPEAIEGEGYTPWINPMGLQPDELGERLLFSLQVAIGGAIIGYFVGHETGKGAREKTNSFTAQEKKLV